MNKKIPINPADVLDGFKPGESYTLQELAVLHAVPQQSMRRVLEKIEAQNKITQRRDGLKKTYQLGRAPVSIEKYVSKRQYEFPQSMLDQLARCAENRLIRSLGGD